MRQCALLRKKTKADCPGLPTQAGQVSDERDEAGLRRLLLKQLVNEDHFKRSDGLDVYVDDYSHPELLSREGLRSLNHAQQWLAEEDRGVAGKDGRDMMRLTPVDVACEAARCFPEPEPLPSVEYQSNGRVLLIGAGRTVEKVTAGFSGQEVVHLERVAHLRGWLGRFEAHADDGHKVVSDLVLNLGEQTLFEMHQPPQGYYAPRDEAELELAVAELRDAIGTFEKPKFFSYDERLCAHSRAKLDGCNRCIQVCSTMAIEAKGNGIVVEPHLCMGCGACATVCPSGALRYNFPAMSYWGRKLKAVLAAFEAAGGAEPVLILHEGEWASILPNDAIPLQVHHIATIGMDWLLGAVALGVHRVLVRVRGDEAPQYLDALQEAMQTADLVLNGLGYDGCHFERITTNATLGGEVQVPPDKATFHWFDEKRTTLEFAIDHLRRHAPKATEIIALPQGAPWGEVVVDGEVCTLCFACVTVCPAGALQDGQGLLRLNFIERNCLQCGLCETGCPEQAIRLAPRLALTNQAKKPRTLHGDDPFACVRCGTKFGSKKLVEGMVRKLESHPMFSDGRAVDRLRMCGECRVVDILEST